MKKRFITLYESWLKRSNHSGFLVGDIVEFTDGCLKHDFCKSQSSENILGIKALVDCKGTVRVTNVINKYPAVMGAGNPDNFSSEYNIEVSEDNGGGRLGNSAIVHVGMIKKIDTVPNLEPVPDKNKRIGKITIKPEVVKDEAEETPFYSTARTKTSDLGNGKLAAGDRSLKNVNITIPSAPNAISKDPGSYTADYLPKA